MRFKRHYRPLNLRGLSARPHCLDAGRRIRKEAVGGLQLCCLAAPDTPPASIIVHKAVPSALEAWRFFFWVGLHDDGLETLGGDLKSHTEPSEYLSPV